jgi:hypothetical protein
MCASRAANSSKCTSFIQRRSPHYSLQTTVRHLVSYMDDDAQISSRCHGLAPTRHSESSLPISLRLIHSYFRIIIVGKFHHQGIART